MIKYESNMERSKEEFPKPRIIQKKIHQIPGAAYEEIVTTTETFYRPLPWREADYWKRKEITYQAIYESGDWSVEVVGFNGMKLILEQEREIAEFFRGTPGGFARNNPYVKAILLDDQLMPGEPEEPGLGSYFGNFIRLTPKPLKGGEYRVGSVSILKGVLAHEFTEALIYRSEGKKFIEKWANLFGFEKDEKGKFTVCRSPERCITEYARSGANEDICDSIVAFLYNPETLDETKADVLKEQFLILVQSTSQNSTEQ